MLTFANKNRTRSHIWPANSCKALMTSLVHYEFTNVCRHEGITTITNTTLLLESPRMAFKI